MVAPTCLPSWWEMNSEVVHALSRQIAQFCAAEQTAEWVKQINARRDVGFFPPEFQAEIIAEHYGPDYFKVLECLDGDEPNAVHLAIAALAGSGHVRAVVTSNFDRLLELAFERSGVPLEVCFRTEDFERLASELEAAPAASSPCRLLKLHGSVEDHLTLVDTLAQRMRGLPPAICSCLQQLLRSYYWVFLGYSGRDLEGNPQYLCLESEVDRAAGFSWLVRGSAKEEPIPAVQAICALYGDRARAPRGDLPSWFLEQFRPFLPQELLRPPSLSDEELDRRRRSAAQAIVDHTREWSVSVGGVRAALAIADMLERSVANPQAAVELLSATLGAQEQDDRAYVVVANALVNSLAHVGKFDEALDLAETALARTGTSDLSDKAALLSNMGLVNQARGQYHQALERFEEAYEDSIRCNDEPRRSIALHNRALALTSLGRPDAAMVCYEEELQIVTESGDALAQAETLNNMGDLLRQQDRYAEAIDVLRRAIALRERLGDDRGVASSLGNIAAAYQWQGELGEAKSIYEQVLVTFRRVGDREHEVTTMRNLGSIVEELGDLDGAWRVFRRALVIAAEHGMNDQRAKVLMKMGSLCRTTGRAAESGQLFDQALAIHRSSGEKAGVADVLNEQGILCWQEGRLDAAESTFNQVIATREQLRQLGGLCEVLGNVALVLIDKGQLDEAMTMLERSLSIAEDLHAKRLIASAHYSIGALLHRRGDIGQSITSFESAQGLYLQVGLTCKALDILATMGEICGRQGDIDASLHWFDRAIPLSVDVTEQSKISTRLTGVLEVLLRNGYGEVGQQYIQRLEAVGARVTIEKI